MNHSPRAAILALIALAVIAAGCGKSKKTTAPEPVTSRTVTIELRDSTGVPISGITVWAAAANGQSILGGPTDANGHRSVTLPVGPADAALVPDFAEVIPRTLAAGGTFNVPGDSRPASDTIMVRLVARTGSFIAGVVHRPGATTDHSGVVIAPPHYLRGAVGFSNSTGAYSLGRVPPGDWEVLYTDVSAGLSASQVVHVPSTPGTVTAATITMATASPGQLLKARPLMRRIVR